MKIKEGGGMDIQEERELFEKLPEIKKRLDMKCAHFNGIWYVTNPHMGNSFATAGYLNGAWMAWQAAKSQAVPEGFVLMPKEPTDEIIEAMNEFDYRNDYSDMDGAYRTIVETLEKAQAVPDVVNNRKWISCADVRACRKKAMTEAAQEPTND